MEKYYPQVLLMCMSILYLRKHMFLETQTQSFQIFRLGFIIQFKKANLPIATSDLNGL